MIEVVLDAAAAPLRPLLVANAHGSLSHTDGLAAVALCQDADVGVDVERVRDVKHMAGIAARLGVTLPDEGARDAFFAAWVRAEAQGKALRQGLSAPAAERDAVWCVPLDGLPDGYTGAVACVAGPREVTVRPRRA